MQTPSGVANAPRETEVNQRSFEFGAGMQADAAQPFFGAADGGEVLRVVPTTEAQREIWLADRLGDEASLAYNESASLHFEGTLDAAALAAALSALGERHEALRSTVGADGTELWVSSGRPLEARLVDLSGLGEGEQEQAVAAERARAVETRFDLAAGPLARAVLMRRGALRHELMITAHHVVCDGWSLGVLATELMSLYRAFAEGQPSFLEDAPRYSDHALAQRTPEALAQQGEDERWWVGLYDRSIPTLDLPVDRARTGAHRGFTSLREDHVLDAALTDAVKRLGAQHNASLFATLFSAFSLLLARVAATDDLVVGVPAAGQPVAGTPGLVGHCVNILPIRVAVDPARSVAAQLADTRGRVLDAYDHQSVTFGSLLKKLQVERDPARLPLVSVLFNLDAAIPPESLSDAALRVHVVGNPRHAENFELFVNVVPADGGLRVECQYNTGLFDATTVRRWLDAFETLLRAMARDPARPLGELEAIGAGQAQALRALQPAPTPLAPAERMHSAFERQARATPARAALRMGDDRLSYGELDAQANRLAHALRARGIGRGERVGLCVNRGLDMVVSMLAVMKSGATYVPLDPGFPPSRLAYYAEDARLALLVTESSIATAPTAWRDDAAGRVLVLDRDADWRQQPAEPLEAGPQDAQAQDAAYVIYTSGSTGRPKGVSVPHRAVANFLASMAREPGIAADDRLAAVTTLSFDIAVLELILPLTVGAECVVVPREAAMDGNRLCALLRECGATMMQATPGMWRVLLDTDWQGGPGFKALVGGESCPPDLAHAMLGRCGEVWNMYGPTETTVWSTLWRVDAARVARTGVSIGRPIANTQVWIVDERMQPCPIGVPGEICIGGQGVALGYLDRPELTAERFVADELGGAGGLLYRTGDRGRWRNDGLLEHLGRLDFQVKVRGYRIELGEIEAACNEFAGVAASVVTAREDRPGDVRLVAYVTMATGAALDKAALKAHLRERLPEYMLPQHFVALDALPLLPNGKVDRKALPAPTLGRAHEAVETSVHVAPRTELEHTVLAAMEAVLNLPGLSMRDDFFALGGHSLLAARLASRLSRDVDAGVSLRTLFEAPTAEKLVAAIERARAGGAVRRAPIAHDPSRRSAPLTPMQERIRFIEELHPGRVVYNTPSAHRLTGPMDRAKFEQAVQAMVAVQPALRTVIAATADGTAFEQRVLDDLDVALPFEDLSALPADRREAELMARMQAVVDTPMDILAAPLFRTALYKLGEEEHAFFFMPHHIVWDGWSFDLLYEDLSAIYGALVAGETPAPPVPAITYLDYAHWMAAWMKGPEAARQLQYWKNRFANAPLPRQPKTDKPRQPGMSGEGATEWVRFDRELTERLRDVARVNDLTLSMLAMSVYAAMMATAIGTKAIVVGLPVRGRQAPETEGVMGFFNNLLPVQFVVDPARTLAEFLQEVKRDTLEVFEHQELPFERLAEEPEVSSRASRFGLYQALFSFQDARERRREWGPLHQQSILLFQKGATEDLGLWLMEVPHGLEGGFTYNSDIYLPETAAALRERYTELLRRVAAQPGISLAELVAPEGSAAGQLLRRMAGDDEAAAPVAAPAAPDAAATPAAPVSEAAALSKFASDNERALAKIWAGLLDVDVGHIAPADNFFDLGGNSLLAMRAVEFSGRTLGFRIDARRYFYESLAQLANEQAAAPAAAPAATAAARTSESRGLLKRVFGSFGGKGVK
jgi:amino acid adenylation domain-containing protein